MILVTREVAFIYLELRDLHLEWKDENLCLLGLFLVQSLEIISNKCGKAREF